MPHIVIQILPTLAILGILIAVHEFGHFIAARLTGVVVEKFVIGFGPELFAWQGKTTRYALCLIPFGGYVKMMGDLDEEIKKRGQPKKGDFLYASPFKRALIIVAGVAMNYFLAYWLFVSVLFIGRPLIGTTIANVQKGYPAEVAGMAIGDRVTEINHILVNNWQDVQAEIVKEPGRALIFSVQRGDKKKIITVQPKVEEVRNVFGEVQRVSRVGIVPSAEQIVTERYEFKKSLKLAAQLQWSFTVLTYEALGRLVTGRLSLKTISGPIGIASMTIKAAEMGVMAVVQLAALLSLSLAIVNLLPIPALDGGHLLFLIPEVIMKRPVDIRIQERITQIGFYFLIVLMVLTVFNDLINLGVVDKMKEWFHFYLTSVAKSVK